MGCCYLQRPAFVGSVVILKRLTRWPVVKDTVLRWRRWRAVNPLPAMTTARAVVCHASSAYLVTFRVGTLISKVSNQAYVVLNPSFSGCKKKVLVTFILLFTVFMLYSCYKNQKRCFFPFELCKVRQKLSLAAPLPVLRKIRLMYRCCVLAACLLAVCVSLSWCLF